MAKLLVILGAGASRDAGAPIVRDFLDRAADLRRNGDTTLISPDDFKLVFDLISELEVLHSRSDVDLRNVESVFNLLAMAQLAGRLLHRTPDEIDLAARAMERVLAQTIEASIKFHCFDGDIRPSQAYDKLARGIDKIRKTTTGTVPWSFITFNYDVALEQALTYYDIPVDYGLPDVKTEQGAIPVLKLHGSLNWSTCPGCARIRVLGVPEYLQRHILRTTGHREVRLPISRSLHEVSCCVGALRDEPVIIPPSWKKARYYDSLSAVWTRAARELAEADNIAIVGFSMPPADTFFRDLFALGVASDTWIRQFVVVNPDQGLKEHFAKLLGPTLLSRFTYHAFNFDWAADWMLGQDW